MFYSRRRERNVAPKPVPTKSDMGIQVIQQEVEVRSIHSAITDKKRISGDPLPSGESPVRLLCFYEWPRCDGPRKVYDLIFDLALRGEVLGNGLTALSVDAQYAWGIQGVSQEYGRDYETRYTGLILGTLHLSETERQIAEEYNELHGGNSLVLDSHNDTIDIEQDLKDLYDEITKADVHRHIEDLVYDNLSSLGLHVSNNTEYCPGSGLYDYGQITDQWSRIGLN